MTQSENTKNKFEKKELTCLLFKQSMLVLSLTVFLVARTNAVV